MIENSYTSLGGLKVRFVILMSVFKYFYTGCVPVDLASIHVDAFQTTQSVYLEMDRYDAKD